MSESKYTPEQQQKIDGAHKRHARMKAHMAAHAERFRDAHVAFWAEWHRQGKTMADASRIMLEIESEIQRRLHAGQDVDGASLARLTSGMQDLFAAAHHAPRHLLPVTP